jgi:predicted alpha/beta hydrolase family esterase
LTTVIIVHGTGGSPEGNWFPWLQAELEALGHTVLVPRFPTPEGQSLYTWFEAFQGYEHYLQDAILVGHSIGPAFLLRVLEKTDATAKAAFFVAPFMQPLGNDFDLPNKSFIEAPVEWERISRRCGSFTVIASDNDPYVPLAYSQEVAQELGAEVVVLHNAKHINKDAGYTQLPVLLDLIVRALR